MLLATAAFDDPTAIIIDAAGCPPLFDKNLIRTIHHAPKCSRGADSNDAFNPWSANSLSRLQFHGVRAAGAHIALFGGLMTVFDMAASSLMQWVMAYPGVAQDTAVLRALYYLSFAFGGVGFSVPMGILIAGICIPAAFLKLLPKWLIIFGLVIAVMGELSWLDLITSKALPFIPLTRFPSFLWLIAAGFMLPKAKPSQAATS